MSAYFSLDSMSRPTFTLSDSQAKALVQGVPELVERFPVDGRNHRPFTAAFLRLVYMVTGKTYGPDIYRRLLGVYAPDRRPSNNTLALEKSLLEQNPPERGQSINANAPGAQVPIDATHAHAIAQAVREGVTSAFEEFVPLVYRMSASINEDQHAAHFAYLRSRMEQLEAAAASARSDAARLAAELQEAHRATEIYREQLQACQAALSAHAEAAAKQADEHAELRKFSLMSIEGARGETRELRDVCRLLENEIAQREIELDALRRRDYRNAAPSLAKGESE